MKTKDWLFYLGLALLGAVIGLTQVHTGIHF